MKTIFTSLIFILCANLIFAQNVTIPDPNFKTALLAHDPIIDTNSDGEIQVSEAIVVGYLDLEEKAISDLTGIEAFQNLMGLQLEDNFITEVDLSSNTMLTSMNIANNQLSNIDLSQNIHLHTLTIGGNDLTTLDLSSTPLIENLSIGYNQLTEIDLSSLTVLANFTSLSNQFETLDLSASPMLSFVSISSELSLRLLNLQNGNNEVLDIYLNDLPDLECVIIDPDFVETPPETWVYPEGTTFTSKCALSTTDLNLVELSIYPNPVKNEFFIQSDEKVELVEIYSLSGEKIYSQTSSNIKSVKVSQLSKGVYLTRIKTQTGKVFTQKIIIN